MRRVALFAEDSAHEYFCRPLIERLSREVGIGVRIQVRSARGGIPAAQDELTAYQLALRKGVLEAASDLLCVAIDANCEGHAQRRRRLESVVDGALFPNVAYLCPDPHVERWYLADLAAFARVVGGGPSAPPSKCARKLYKRLLREAVEQAGHVPMLDGTEYGEDLVFAMDLYQAGKAVPSLGAAVDDIRAGLRLLSRRHPR